MATNSEAMERFLTSVERRAFRMAQIATRSTEDALDIVQDAMLGLVTRYAAKSESEWKPLFYRILTSRIRDWQRRKAVRDRFGGWLPTPHGRRSAEGEDPFETVPDPDRPSPVDRMVLDDAVAALDSALGTLPLRQQQAFLLRAWEGLNVRETARAMGCTAGSVKTHYSRAIHALRSRLEDYRP